VRILGQCVRGSCADFGELLTCGEKSVCGSVRIVPFSAEFSCNSSADKQLLPHTFWCVRLCAAVLVTSPLLSLLLLLLLLLLPLPHTPHTPHTYTCAKKRRKKNCVCSVFGGKNVCGWCGTVSACCASTLPAKLPHTSNVCGRLAR